MGAFRRDSRGIARVLKSSDMAAMVKRAAGKIATDARATSGLPVEVNEYTTDRAASSVVITDPAGAPTQAKHGTLTRAASSIGVEVRDR